MTSFSFTLTVIRYFIQARWLCNQNRIGKNSEQFKEWQETRLRKFLRKAVQESSFYQHQTSYDLLSFPIINKSIFLENFAALNVLGMSYEQAFEIAIRSEKTRNFKEKYRQYSLGLSSGTQGKQGVFLTAPHEQAKWLGILIAYTLPNRFLKRLLFLGKKIQIAFFLRANNNLYTNLNSNRIALHFYDLHQGLSTHLHAVEENAMDILVAPASILKELARLKRKKQIDINPRHIISVAEVLEKEESIELEQVFQVSIHQIYQCTEGFLGSTCENGTLHLNEGYVHIEKKWLDIEQTRFTPIITDFSRESQYIVRYQLNDVLRIKKNACSCNRIGTAIEAIEGRCDDVLWFKHRHNKEVQALFPDILRNAISIHTKNLHDYQIFQNHNGISIASISEVNGIREYNLLSQNNSLKNTLISLCEKFDWEIPTLYLHEFEEKLDMQKRRRIVCNDRSFALF